MRRVAQLFAVAILLAGCSSSTPSASSSSIASSASVSPSPTASPSASLSSEPRLEGRFKQTKGLAIFATFTPTCPTGPCDVVADIPDFGAGDFKDLPMTYNGTDYRGTSHNRFCEAAGKRQKRTDEFTVTVREADIVNGELRATKINILWVHTATVVAGPSGACLGGTNRIQLGFSLVKS